MPSSDVRAVLQYVPQFRDKIFAVHIPQALIPAAELVDVLLDLDALHEIGVRVVIFVEGNSALEIYDRCLECEMRVALSEKTGMGSSDQGRALKKIIDRGQIPVAAAGMGCAFENLSVSISCELKATKFIALLDGEIPRKSGQPIAAISVSEVPFLSGEITARDLLEKAALACNAGISRVHLLDGHRRSVIVDELFSNEGVGTMVHTDLYREIRALKEEDIPELLSMIGRSVHDAKLIERTYENVCERIEDYFVLTLDEAIVGSVAVHLFAEQKSAEVACLYIKREHEGRGYGRALVKFTETRAKNAGMETVFALSQSAVIFFRDRLGYETLPREVLPPSRLTKLQSSGRQSQVFGRKLT